jgi:hypothetical protein
MPASLEDLLSGTRIEGQEKTASPQSRPVGQEETNYATELAMLEKFAQENFTQDDMLKIAASSKISADIMTDIQIEKMASAMPILVKVAMEHVLPQILPGLLKEALQKVAVGNSEVISGGKPADTVEKDPHSQTMDEDELGKSEEPVGARQMAHAERTEGASAQGGGAPESNQGEPMENTHGNTVAPKVAMDPAMLEQLAQKVASGTASPQEIQMYQQLMAAQQGGGMERTAAHRQNAIAELIRSRLG